MDLNRENHTIITTFILDGLSNVPEVQYLLFVLFLCIYIITIAGNLTLILAIKHNSKLHIPMYFHLGNFSFLEICYVSVTVPKMLSNLLAKHKTISFLGCAIQMYCFFLFGTTENNMLEIMAYDRYNAICHPLLYTIIMNRKKNIQLILGAWFLGAVISLVHNIPTFNLPFCGNNHINQFFCDVPPLLKLACTDTWINEIVLFVVGGFVVIGSFLPITVSYTLIIFTVIKIHSASGTKKAFSTCVSHFIVVIIFYGSDTFMYCRPKSSYAMNQDRVVAMFYSVIAPCLNPFIYSFRNSDVKTAIKEIIQQTLMARQF
ncbi:LOW QUALITY PROTEIN: olfactory receptor 5A2-like [Discoglossus pictus]